MLHAIYIGDIHLERLVNLLSTQMDAEHTVKFQLKALRIVYDYAKTQNIKHIIFLGDLFHSANPRQSTIALFLQFLSEYPGIANYIILGNHDYSSEGKHSQLTLSAVGKYIKGANIQVFDKPTSIFIEDVPYFFCPWPFIVAPNKPHICIGHFDLNGAHYSNGYIVKNNVLMEHLGKDNYWIIGHIHTAQKYYPGTLYQINFGEELTKGFLETKTIFNNNKLIVKDRWNPLKPIFELHSLRFDNEEQLDSISASQTKIIKLIRHKTSPDVSQHWLLQHPNVIVSGIREKIGVAQMTQINRSLPEIRPDFGLRDFLNERGCSELQINQGLSIIRDVITGVML